MTGLEIAFAEWNDARRRYEEATRRIVRLTGFRSDDDKRPAKVAVIQDLVAKFYQVSITDLVGDCRHQVLVIPRHVAIYFCRQITRRSFSELGRDFNRDHGSIIYAMESVINRIATKHDFLKEIETIRGKLKSAIEAIDLPLFRDLPPLSASKTGT